MIDQSYRLPLAQYLRVLALAQDLDAKILEEVSIESVEAEIKRQLESILPASEAGVGLQSYQDLKREDRAVRRILNTIESEIQPVAAMLTPGFVDRLREGYDEKRVSVQKKLELSDELDQAYRQIRDKEKEALEKKKETLLEAYKVGVSLPSVSDLVQELKRIEATEGEIREFEERSAQEWATLAEGQIAQEKAKAYWEKAIEHDNSPQMYDRRDRHIAALQELGEETIGLYEGTLKEAKELFDRATGAPGESASQTENDLRSAVEKCDSVILALANYPYPSATRQEAQRLKGQITSYNDFIWHTQAIGNLAQAQLDLTGDNLDQANENLAHAREAVARIWDDVHRSSLEENIEAAQQKVETKARQRVDHVIATWRQQAQANLDNNDPVAALNCIYAARALSPDEVPDDESSQELEALEDKALAMLSHEVNVDAKSLAARAKEFLSRQDSQSAFRWLEAALQLDARAVLSDSVFKELTDAYFEFQYKRQKAESLLFQAEYGSALDAGNSDGVVAAEALLEEAKQLFEEIGETDRLQEVDEKRLRLQQLQREALGRELDDLLQELQDTLGTEEASSQQMTQTLSILKELTHVLAKFDKAGFSVENVKPHLEKAFEYYDRLRSDDELKDDPSSVEGYSLSYMLLRKAGRLESS